MAPSPSGASSIVARARCDPKGYIQETPFVRTLWNATAGPEQPQRLPIRWRHWPQLYRAHSSSFRFGRRELPVAALVAVFLHGVLGAYRRLRRMGGGAAGMARRSKDVKRYSTDFLWRCVHALRARF